LVDLKLPPLLTRLRKFGRVEVCGSYRREKEIIGDVDLVGDNPKMLQEISKIGEVKLGGDVYGRIMFRDLPIDLRITKKEAWGTSLMMWTGSKEENIRLRAIAKNKGLKLNEYGLWDKTKNKAKGKSEEQIYKLLGEKYLTPKER
jgi:DNA polymerase (family 10)